MSDLNKIIEDLSKLTVVEAAELSKQLEEKWGVTAAAAAPAAAAAAAPAAEEKSEFTVFLAATGDKKINVINISYFHFSNNFNRIFLPFRERRNILRTFNTMK